MKVSIEVQTEAFKKAMTQFTGEDLKKAQVLALNSAANILIKEEGRQLQSSGIDFNRAGSGRGRLGKWSGKKNFGIRKGKIPANAPEPYAIVRVQGKHMEPRLLWFDSGAGKQGGQKVSKIRRGARRGIIRASGFVPRAQNATRSKIFDEMENRIENFVVTVARRNGMKAMRGK
ncbi:hypothetical protein Barb7_00099 [Bacteroidales bacterium Barb7]|nr:hypothetical protein Barb7_00099 [Bacteroidales bacterium Barb7]